MRSSTKSKLPLCACGCRKRVTRPGNRYLQGHSGGRKKDPEVTITKMCARPGCGNTFTCYRSCETKYCSAECYWATLKGEPWTEAQREGHNNARKVDPWNKGLTAEEDPRLARLSADRRGPGNPAYDRRPWNYGLTKDTDERMAKVAVPRTLETRRGMSERASRRIMNGYDPNIWGQSGDVYLPRLRRSYHFRSSYEKRTLALLDANPDVVEIQYECIEIPYTMNDGSSHLYVPDYLVFFADGTVWILEVKPRTKLNEKKTRKQFAAARRYAKKHGMEFIIWTEDDIFKDGSSNDAA